MDPEIYAQMARLEQHHWWYLSRRLVCKNVLRDYLGQPGRLRLLDVGCGTGYNLGWLKEWGEAHGIEPSPEGLALCAASGVSVVSGGVEALPYPDQHFDLVTAFDVIEHVADDIGALNEMRRVLRPGGWLLIYTPSIPWLFGEHDRRVHHLRRYETCELRSKVGQANFDIAYFSSVNLVMLPVIALGKLIFDLIPGRPHLEMRLPPWPINFLLKWLAFFEAFGLRRWPLPYGMSIVCLARRPF